MDLLWILIGIFLLVLIVSNRKSIKLAILRMSGEVVFVNIRQSDPPYLLTNRETNEVTIKREQFVYDPNKFKALNLADFELFDLECEVTVHNFDMSEKHVLKVQTMWGIDFTPENLEKLRKAFVMPDKVTYSNYLNGLTNAIVFKVVIDLGFAPLRDNRTGEYIESAKKMLNEYAEGAGFNIHDLRISQVL